MKILVFDDSIIHRNVATAQLREHELSIVGTYDEAAEALTPHVNEFRMSELMKAAGFPPEFKPYDKSVSEERYTAYHDAREKAHEEAMVYPAFDAVLTDLLVPASRKTQGDKGLKFAGQEMPLGSIIALRALAVGVKMIAVVTDANHHDHPASAALDHFPFLSANGVKVFCTNRALASFDAVTFEKVEWKFLDTEEGKKKYPSQPDYSHAGLVHSKDWAGVLQTLLTEVVPR